MSVNCRYPIGPTSESQYPGFELHRCRFQDGEQVPGWGDLPIERRDLPRLRAPEVLLSRFLQLGPGARV